MTLCTNIWRTLKRLIDSFKCHCKYMTFLVKVESELSIGSNGHTAHNIEVIIINK